MATESGKGGKMTSLDQARPVRQGESLDVDAIAAYLKDNLSGLDGSTAASPT